VFALLAYNGIEPLPKPHPHPIQTAVELLPVVLELGADVELADQEAEDADEFGAFGEEDSVRGEEGMLAMTCTESSTSASRPRTRFSRPTASSRPRNSPT
jgi:hypothetical protein